MNQEAFAFFNQQLATMLREGIPLEGALKQLCAGMKVSPLRAELQQLESDLTRGTPLKDAVAKRSLPQLYVQMMNLGTRSNDLPGVLTMLADHYQRVHSLWTRLKGLMVYPFIVIIVSLGLTVALSFTFTQFISSFFNSATGYGRMPPQFMLIASIWGPPVLLAIALVLGIALFSVSRIRAALRWRVPGFREASLAQIASAIALMLKNGMPLAEALALAEGLESNTPARKTLAQWRQLVESGSGKPSQWPQVARPFPPLFLWLVRSGGEDVTAGFQKAAEIYQARASYRIELMLYAALPVSILLLGQMVFWQIAPLMQSLIGVMRMLGDMGG